MKTRQSTVISGLCLKENSVSERNHMPIVTSSFFERLRFQNLFCPKLKPAFLECTVGLTEEIKQRFQIPYGVHRAFFALHISYILHQPSLKIIMEFRFFKSLHSSKQFSLPWRTDRVSQVLFRVFSVHSSHHNFSLVPEVPRSC